MNLEKEKIERVYDWYKGRKQGPFKIDIELHRRCNLKCLSCSRRQDKKYGHINQFSKSIELSLEKWLSVVKDAALLGVREWHVAGGGDPPLLKQITFPVLKEIKRFNMYGILTTNGTNLSYSDLEFLVRIGWDRIHFSLDGTNAKTHDYLRQAKGCFDKTVKTIRILNRLKQKFRTKKLMLNINFVLSKKNYTQLPELVKLARKLDVEYIFVEPLIIYSEHGKKLKLDEEDLKLFGRYLKNAIILSKKYKIDSNFTSIQSNLDSDLIKYSSSMNMVVKNDMKSYENKNQPFLELPCYDPWFHMTIKADGRAISCDVSSDNTENIKNKNLKEIWYGTYFSNLRKNMLQKKIPTYCKQCNPSHTTQRRWLRELMIKNKI
jgi:MoaA/NifB/PqqE/SkfB family radical SAM enzyme